MIHTDEDLEFSGHQIKSLRQVAKMVMNNGGTFMDFHSSDELMILAEFLNQFLTIDSLERFDEG